ncbi:unnamed protein product [Acanthoscelides obtectus]|uniref:Uncharacterized protein n=1 Tax=Acanthoscelides obtectus TaxID=200917 RepID=A0A9P0LGP9_ACAOB|nr:unnamed protein product [Acanthoscelides obtectus]CAK1627162.1 hypothetical protein AOBTE_LOCUS4351 [Acanthoscelides obtectus]
MDIECYEGFNSAQVHNEDIQFSIDSPVKKQRALALTYYKDYSFKDIKLLDDKTFEGGMKFVEWMGIIPDDLSAILMRQPEHPFLVKNATLDDLSLYMPCWQKVEEILGKYFNNTA